MAANKYDANSISILEGLEAVRMRPGMYIGSVGTKGLNHLIYEIADNSVDEHLAGFCTQINVTLNDDGTATIKDNGRGIPIGIHPKAGIPAVEVVFTVKRLVHAEKMILVQLLHFFLMEKYLKRQDSRQTR